MKQRKIKREPPPSTEEDTSKYRTKKYGAKKNDMPKLLLIPLAIVVTVLGSLGKDYWYASKVNTPLEEPRVVENNSHLMPENLDRYWGTYRPNLYFGLKTRSENPLSVGMMWLNQMNPKFHMRHWCNQNDGLSKYGWTAHDGRNFGIHDIYESSDNRFILRNTWVKRTGGTYGGDWSVKTEVNPFNVNEPPKFVSVFFYFAKNSTGWIKSVRKNNKKQQVLVGETDDLGKFQIKLDTNNNENVFVNVASVDAPLAILNDYLINNQYFARIKTESQTMKEYVGLRGTTNQEIEGSNTLFFQVSGIAPFQFQVIFESESLLNESKEKFNKEPVELNGAEFENLLTKHHGNFQNKFERVFQLRDKQLSGSEIMMAQAALSNLIGGIGFFTGQSIVKSIYSKEPVLYWESSLYTAVPSRSFFPRGFLWDEGFHNILIAQWDSEISKDIIAHWLDLMNTEGWIPREVILGDEARAKVPQEFWIQNHEYANPPALFIPLEKLVNRVKDSIVKNPETKSGNPEVSFLRKAYPRLKNWYNWFNKTQTGKLPFTYRWRGRHADVPTELNPKTLTSGLDDYPRASNPTDQERNLDLRCWMALASKVMSDIAEICDNSQESNAYYEHYTTLSDNNLLDALHWSGSQYADYGLHSDRIKLVRPPPRMDNNMPPKQEQMVRKVEVEQTYQFVNSVGYVSLFPMLTQILKPDSEKLNSILDQIKDPQLLWTPYGLRSLAKNAPLYNKRNTEHDPPYWRGAIWININYLTLRSLKHYSTLEGPYKQKAAEIYKDLRLAVIKNILDNYSRTGYIWEQYNDVNGKGQGSHPFTGWSALVTLIMAEKY